MLDSISPILEKKHNPYTVASGQGMHPQIANCRGRHAQTRLISD